jgi:eukaryotic-like serine/threonine-protein kinase
MSAGSNVVQGDLLAGKYRVERVLGRGGMGIVVAARHLQLDERVAIKLMLPEIAANGEAVARFIREARAAAKIKSEHVVRVFDVATLEDGQPYMVMEYLDGSDLGALLAAHGRLSVGEAIEYLAHVLDAIGEAHRLGIVHRDLKPSNLFLTRGRDGSPVVKVLDFGISKLSGPLAADESVTRSSALLGSPLYMSPEQLVSSRDVDARSDIWALGVILFELLTGVRPFQAPSLPQACSLILQGYAPKIREQVAQVPEPLEAAISRCLEREPAARFANVSELATVLAPFAPPRARALIERVALVFCSNDSTASSSSVLASTLGIEGTPGAEEPKTDASWGRTAGSLRSRSAPLLAIGTVALSVLAVALAVGYALRRTPEGDPAAKSAAQAPASGKSVSPALSLHDAASASRSVKAEAAPRAEPIVQSPAPSTTQVVAVSSAGAGGNQGHVGAAALPTNTVRAVRRLPARPSSSAPLHPASALRPVVASPVAKKPNIFDDRK